MFCLCFIAFGDTFLPILNRYFLFVIFQLFFLSYFVLDTEQEIIQKYFHRGYDYRLITCLLKNEHSINISVRTLKRRLKACNLSKRREHICEEQVRDIIRGEMRGAGCLAGYRKMWHILKLKHHLHVPRKLVQRILKELDPEASNLRKNRMLKRRQYLSNGPNQCWHIDGMLCAR